MENMTAKVSCFARAYHHKNNSKYIFDDNMAEVLLGKDYDEIAKNMSDGVNFFFPGFEGTKEEGLRMIVDKQLSPSVLARSAYCEGEFAKMRKTGCRQYMIFASGYDTFSMRNTDEDLSIYELDLPEMISDKIKRVEKSAVRSSAIYIPCNLAEEAWKENLAEYRYRRDEKSFGSLLGISYYLSKKEFEKLLMNVNEIMAEKSIICFDYPSMDESNETKKNQLLASGAGEKMKAVYSYSEMKALLQKSGFELSEHLDDKEITERYFSEYNKYNSMNQIQAPKGVAYVKAIAGDIVLSKKRI